jgi:II/X family phage/plasmid replication protein
VIDKLVIQIPFAQWAVTGKYDCESDRHCSPFNRKGVFWVKDDCLIFKKGARELYTDDEGNLQADDIYCPWESLGTDHGGLALKCFPDGCGTLAWPFVEIKCSPAKLVQAHNVFGTDDPLPCVENMLYVLSKHYPQITDYSGRSLLEDMSLARVTEIDITYSVKVSGHENRTALIDVLRHTSKGQTRNRGDAYESTVYFGSRRSRLKRIKVYLKGPEILRDIDQRKRKKMTLPTDQVVQQAQDLVRFELTLKKDWFERRGFSVSVYDFVRRFGDDPALMRAVYNDGMADLFKAMDGEVMTVTSDRKVMELLEQVHGDVRGRPARLMGFYQGLKSVGFDALKATYPKRTFQRYLSDLEACGFGRAHLCALHSTKGNTVVAFPRVVHLDGLGEPAPVNYEYPRLVG